jgi:hypothetical protein
VKLVHALAAVLLLGMAVAWSPRYWSTAVAIAGICVVTTLWAATARKIERSRLWLPVGLISGWGALQLATHTSVAPWQTMRATLSWLACGLSFFLASQLAVRGKQRRVFLWWLLWGGAALSMAVLFPADAAIAGTFLYKNHFAAMVEMVAPIALWRGLTIPRHRAASAAAFAILFAAVVASASRMGVVLLVAELFIAIAVVCGRGGLPWRTAVSLTAISVVVLAAASWIAGPARILEHFHEKNPWAIRAQLLESTLRMSGRHLWLGSGMGTWRTVYPAYATFDAGLIANEAHNDWAEWTAEGGLPFLSMMAFLVICLARPAVQSIWGLGVLMVMVHSLVDYPIRDPATGLLWFSLAGALSQFRHKSNGPTTLFAPARASETRQTRIVR